MRTLHLVGLLLVALLLPLPSQARWDSARDNKSSSQLAAMSNQELFDEAFDVCVRRALLESLPSPAEETSAALTECSNYLNTLSAVSERNTGTVPPWMSTLVTAHTTKDCQDAFRMFLTKTEKPAVVRHPESVEPAGEPRPTRMPKPTPAQPRSKWSEQLPPWIAPR